MKKILGYVVTVAIAAAAGWIIWVLKNGANDVVIVPNSSS
jgi:hypothetical protein